MIRKLNKPNQSSLWRLKGMVACLLSAFMVLGAVAFAPTQLQANTLPIPQILGISDDMLVWIVEGNDLPDGAQIRLVINGSPVAGWTSSSVAGSVNLSTHSTLTTSATVMLEVFHPHHESRFSSASTWNPTTTTTPSGQLTAPTNLSVAGNVLNWSAVTGANHYRIYHNNTFVAETTAATWTISLARLTELNIAEGTPVHFYVVAQARDGAVVTTTSPRSARFAWNAGDANLITPVIAVNAAGLLTWSGPGAGPQIVRVYRGGQNIHTTDAAVTQIDLTALSLPSGSQNIQIRFLNSAGASISNQSNTVAVNLTGQLPTPTGVTISASTLSWTAVPNATGYRIYVGGAPQNITPAITGTTFNLATLNLASANHNIQVRALGNGTTTLNSALSEGINFRPGAVATPTNVNIAGNTLTWTAVSNAEGYHVYIDGTVRTTAPITATTFDLGTLGLAVGSYDVQVRALGNGTTTHHSNLSTAVTFNMQTVQLPTPTNVHLQDQNVLHWNEVPNARHYLVYVGDMVNSPPITTTFFAIASLNLPVGHHYVSVRAVGDGVTTVNSALSSPVQVTVGATTPPPAPLDPNDLPSGWALNYVQTAVNEGIVPQNLRGSFTRATTRAEFAALAVALYETVMGYEIVGRMQFNDTQDVNVQKMGALGVVLGVGYNNFAPNDPLTRAQAATMIARLAAAMNQPLAAVPADFPDNAEIPAWAMTSVGQVQAARIMTGADHGMFWPQWDYTREQSIVTMLRLFDIVN